MNAEQALAFTFFAVVAAVTPGPSNFLLTATGARVGIIRGSPCLLGVAAGMGAMMFLVPLGLGSLVLDRPALLETLRWCGAAFLLWLAWRIATAGPAGAAHDPRPVGFVGAAVFQWVNPKSWLVAAAAAGSFLQPEAQDAIAQSARLGALFFLTALPCCFLWLAFGATMQRFLREPASARVFNVAMGVLLVSSIALILR